MNTGKYFLPLSFFLLITSAGVAQQDPLYSQYMINPFLLNPAYSGFSKDLNAIAAYRVQWTGLDGAPVTMNASGHIALSENRMGVGLIVLQDEIGIDKTTQVIATYGYHLLLQDNKKISFGLRGGLVNYKSDYSELIIDESDPKFQSSISEWKPSIGAGVIFSSDRFYAGLSVPNMIKTTTTVNDVEIILYNQHAYVHVAYLMTLSPRLKIKPFVLARAVQGAEISVDAGATLQADDSYSIGLFTRKLNTFGFLARVHLGENLRLGYVFELPTNKSVGINYPSHEFTLGIRMKVFKSHDVMAISDF